MRIDVHTNGMLIFPENAQDRIYVQRLLGLNSDGDQCICKLKVDEHDATRYLTIRPDHKEVT